ncbi:hypothetical protein [Nonomuraea sp. NPDC050786]|uniref:hypothetical protein n=1 Tax=Nonomuraea sp. NPDC050786 TaxID=3154840 RepID=UPI0033D0FEF6
MTMRSAATVLSKELARPHPTPRRLLRALHAAGFEVRPTVRNGPAWMPTTPDAYALVKRAADEFKAGFNRHEIARRMGKDKRTVDRYLAAADAMGLLDPDREEPPR